MTTDRPRVDTDFPSSFVGEGGMGVGGGGNDELWTNVDLKMNMMNYIMTYKSILCLKYCNLFSKIRNLT